MKTLKMVLLFLTSLWALPQSQAQTIPFADGQIVRIYCLGHLDGVRYLNGATTTGEVNLQSDATLSGVNWKVEYAPNGLVYLRCMGDLDGSRYLHGYTTTGGVNMAVNVAYPATGTLWHLMPYRTLKGGTAYYLRCQGHLDGTRFLNGDTTTGGINLSNELGFPTTGTSWRITKVQ